LQNQGFSFDAFGVRGCGSVMGIQAGLMPATLALRAFDNLSKDYGV